MPPSASSKRPLRWATAPGERALLVAEQLALDERRRQRGAVELTNGRVGGGGSGRGSRARRAPCRRRSRPGAARCSTSARPAGPSRGRSASRRCGRRCLRSPAAAATARAGRCCRPRVARGAAGSRRGRARSCSSERFVAVTSRFEPRRPRKLAVLAGDSRAHVFDPADLPVRGPNAELEPARRRAASGPPRRCASHAARSSSTMSSSRSDGLPLELRGLVARDRRRQEGDT